MEAHWGFSCYIEDTEKNILFDTGTISDLFINNMNELAVNTNNVDMVVLSHEHGDQRQCTIHQGQNTAKEIRRLRPILA